MLKDTMKLKKGEREAEVLSVKGGIIGGYLQTEGKIGPDHAVGEKRHLSIKAVHGLDF